MDEAKILQQEVDTLEIHRELILQLKRERKAKDLSLQDVVALVIAAGETTSLSTARRVFKEGSENEKFSYRRTLKPYAKVLLDISPAAVIVPPNASDEEHDIAALKGIILDKEKVISTLEKQNDFLTKQIERKDEVIKSLQKSNRRFLISVIALLLIIIIYLLVHDIPNPEYGIFQFEAFMKNTAALFRGNSTNGVINQIIGSLKI